MVPSLDNILTFFGHVSGKLVVFIGADGGDFHGPRGGTRRLSEQPPLRVADPATRRKGQFAFRA